MIKVHFNRDAERGMDILTVQLEDKLQKAYDLKNEEVRKLNDKVDRHIRTISSLKRRALLTAQTRKVRRK